MRRLGMRLGAGIVAVVGLLTLTGAAQSGGGTPLLTASSAAVADLASDRGVALDRGVLASLDREDSTDFWVFLDDRPDLSAAARIDDWGERGKYVYEKLTANAEASQRDLIARLDVLGVDHEDFWIANAVLVRGGDRVTLQNIVAEAGVSAIRADEPLVLPEPVKTTAGDVGVSAVEPGVAAIRADQVWEEFGVRGEGIVVGSIDTGVAYTHSALVRQYRGTIGEGAYDHDYDWWDPSHVCPAGEPCDNNNHGTHTTGTMVGGDGGSNAVGVAPDARWIAAKGCENRTCSESALLSSGQFMVAPTNLAGGDPRPDLRPHVVNSSWGDDGGGRDWFDQMVAAWVAAGIFPAFANGNAGPACDTAASPADAPDAYGVGALTANGEIASFSGRGPGRGNQIRPDIAAPGVGVRSSVPGGYGNASGTSMASPHVAGTVALMWSAAGRVGDVAATRDALDRTAVDVEDLSCGGTAEDNNVYGQGRLDALEATRELAIDSGIAGTVTDGNEPVAGVRVEIVGLDRAIETDGDGRYQFRVRPGIYTLELFKFGYVIKALPGVVVTAGEITTADADLEVAPVGRIVGTVRDDVSGHTVPGVRLQVLDVPVDISARTGSDGAFELAEVPAGAYELRASGRWASVTARVTVSGADPTVADIRLPPPFGKAERVSVASDGTEGNAPSGDSAWTSISADGRYVAFYSEATNLVDVPVVARWNVYVHDRHAGVTELVSVSTEEEPADNGPFEGSSWTPSMSADARYVAFGSNAGNLVDRELSWTCRSGREPCGHIYVRDRGRGVTELVSVDSRGAPAAEGTSQNPAISPDGRFVAFASTAANLVDHDLPDCGRQPQLGRNLCQQLYIHDRRTGRTELVSVNGEGDAGNNTSTRPSISADGRYVAWQSLASNLVNEETGPSWDVFLHDRATGKTTWASTLGPNLTPPRPLLGGLSPRVSANGRFVTYGGFLNPWIPVYDRITGETELLSAGADPESVLAVADSPQITGDGRLVTFAAVALDPSSGELLPEATGIFAVDRTRDTLERVVDSYDGSVEFSLGAPAAISADGRQVAVSTESDKLTPGDTNGVSDQYVVDRDFDADEHRPRFAVWDLRVDPAAARPGQSVRVVARVKNVGDGRGSFPATLLVGGVPEHRAEQTVTLAPGKAAEVTLKVAREGGGRYQVSIGGRVGSFRVQSGTLSGQITDANDGTALSGATVTATRDGIARTATTLGGSYRLDDLQLGSWKLTMRADGYVTETSKVTVRSDGEQVSENVALRTGLPSVDPQAIELKLAAGSTATLDLTVTNSGSAALAWNAFAWEATTQDEPSILVYADDHRHLAPNTYIEQALRRLGLDYTAYYGRQPCPGPPGESHDGFLTALTEGSWDLVIVGHECSWVGIPPETLDALHRYVRDGGRLLLHTWQLESANPVSRNHPLWASLGVQSKSELTLSEGPFPVFWWQPAHPLLTEPLRVPELSAPVDAYGFGGWAGVRVEPLAGFDALVGYAQSARPDHAALVLGNDGRTVFRGFFDATNDSDRNDNGLRDGVELWINSLVHVGGLSIRPWLTASDAGTLNRRRSREVEVSVDATGLVPGVYKGSIALVTDAGSLRSVNTPVSLTVTGNEVTGEDSRSIMREPELCSACADSQR